MKEKPIIAVGKYETRRHNELLFCRNGVWKIHRQFLFVDWPMN
jgi:hypothetical protein